MDRSTLLDYINENLDAPQRRAVEQWRQAEPGHEARFQALRKRWEQAPGPRARRALYERIAFEDSPQKQRAVLRGIFAALTAVAVGLSAYFILSQYAKPEAPAPEDLHFVFEDTPLSIVLQDIEQHFAVELAPASESLLDCRFTGRFEDPKLEDLLTTLEFTLDLVIEQRGDAAYVLSGEGCR